MAEINTAEGGSKKKHGGKSRSKKMSTKVDLTPMVDLAFLLITFFMLTTTLNKPNAMELNMPVKDLNDQTKVNEELLLTLVLDKENSVWWYEGITVSDLKKTVFASEKGIRDIIYWKQKKLEDSQYRSKDTMICIIKTTDNASYMDMVDALDEMDITGVKRYTLQDASPLEVEAVENGGTPKMGASPQ
jgi:biopolymer transport protein ExbD